MASSMAAAACSCRSEWRSSSAADPMAPMGFATSVPASVGAEPCTGSYSPGPSPSDADGSSPIEPQTAPASSERMSPNMFSVRITSKRLGSCASSIAHASTYRWSSLTEGNDPAIRSTVVDHSCEVSSTFALSTRVSLPRRP